MVFVLDLVDSMVSLGRYISYMDPTDYVQSIHTCIFKQTNAMSSYRNHKTLGSHVASGNHALKTPLTIAKCQYILYIYIHLTKHPNQGSFRMLHQIKSIKPIKLQGAM